MKMFAFGIIAALVFGFAIGAGTQDLIARRHQKPIITPAIQPYTPSNSPVFVGQLHSNVVVSTNGGRTVFVTK